MTKNSKGKIPAPTRTIIFSVDQYKEIIENFAKLQEDNKGFHRRQDITNGRIAKAEGEILDIKTKQLLSDQSQRELLEDKDVRDNTKRKWSDFFLERLFWAGIVIVLLLLETTGIIHFTGSVTPNLSTSQQVQTK